ncbi:MAG: exodeoxyribonuclease III [Minisyncoccia bacterium]
MKLISWNVNGLRAIHKKGNFADILKKDADILCLQETKVEAEQLPDEVRAPKGYFAYFSHSKMRKGYSGVAVYSKIRPEKVEEGMGLKDMDKEGRLLVLYYQDFVLLNCYFPNGGGGPERLKYKLDFYDAFLGFTERLRKDGHKIIICGDVNTAHEVIDLARPKANETNTGFLPEERAWIDELINHSYVDIYRHLHPHTKDVYTYWDMKTAARDRNVGWRIDYFFISSDLLPRAKQATMLSDFYGSDHCPIVLGIEEK